jgi:hypothetical protein
LHRRNGNGCPQKLAKRHQGLHSYGYLSFVEIKTLFSCFFAAFEGLGRSVMSEKGKVIDVFDIGLKIVTVRLLGE